MADQFQPPEGLREIVAQALRVETRRDIRDGFGESYLTRLSNAVLAALFDACEVREQSHMWFVDGTRSPRYLVLWYQLPDEPIPPVPEGLAELIRSRIGDPPPVSSTGEEPTDHV